MDTNAHKYPQPDMNLLHNPFGTAEYKKMLAKLKKEADRKKAGPRKRGKKGKKWLSLN